MNQHRRDLHRAYVALLEGFDNDFPVWYSYSPAISAGVISRVQGSHRRNSPRALCPTRVNPARLRPDGGVAGMGMHNAANFRVTTIQREMGRVSEEGFTPSTTLPVAIFTTTISSAVITSYSTPDGLITIMPLSRSTALTLPGERHQLVGGQGEIAASTSALSCSNMSCLLPAFGLQSSGAPG